MAARTIRHPLLEKLKNDLDRFKEEERKILAATDRLVEHLETLAGRPLPDRHAAQRGRLIDAMVDGHKYIFEKRAIVFGEEDLVVGLADWLSQIGVVPALCATGEATGRLTRRIAAVAGQFADQVSCREGIDFDEIDTIADEMSPDMIVGNSNGYKLARRLGVPLIRVGLPIHDRLGAQRVEHVGYRGAQALLDRVVNAMIAVEQDRSPVGYTHM